MTVADAAELRALRSELLQELEDFFQFFDPGGVDHEHGGFCCGLAHDGRRMSSLKFVWFNGRGVWTYARAFNLGYLKYKSPPRNVPSSSSNNNNNNSAGMTDMDAYLLDVAHHGAQFALEHGREHSGADAAWIVEMAQDGEPLKAAEPNYIPTSGYGMAFVGEGCIEAFLSLLGDGAAASDDERLSRLLATSLDCLSGFVRLMDDPSRPGDTGPWGSVPVGTRTLGHHMICLNFGRQVRRALVAAAAKSSGRGGGSLLVGAPLACYPPRSGSHPEPDAAAKVAELTALLHRMVRMILGPFVHREFGLLRELLTHGYEAVAGDQSELCYLGHAVETLWMVMAFAEEEKDERLYAQAARLFRRHVDCAWDPLAGGYFRGIHMRTWRPMIDA
jgi:N-acylglucosamine 2-epimerase